MSETITQELASHASRMYRVALRIVGSVDAAQEVAQDACVKALRRAETFDGRAALATWLHRITVNCAKDAMRSDGRRASTLQAFQDSVAQGTIGAATDSPAAVAEKRELADLAWALLDKLPEDCRSAFALTQLDGYSYDEAAEIEGQPRGTMASRVFRAKKIILEQMSAHIE